MNEQKYEIAYGVDTETLEDPDQIILLRTPWEWSELDNEEFVSQARAHWHDGTVEIVALVPWDATQTAIATALQAEGLDEEKIAEIITTVADAVDNA